MAADVKRFIQDNGLDNVILAGHSMYVFGRATLKSRGAKVALYLTLTRPDIPRAIISMENAPISKPLSPTFQQYVEAMRAISDANLTRRQDAEEILAKYEGVCGFKGLK